MKDIGIKNIKGKGAALRKIDTMLKKNLTYPQGCHSIRLRAHTKAKEVTQERGLQNNEIFMYKIMNAQVNM